MRKLLSPFFATRSINRIVFSGKVMLMRRCTELMVHTHDVYVKRLVSPPAGSRPKEGAARGDATLRI